MPTGDVCRIFSFILCFLRRLFSRLTRMNVGPSKSQVWPAADERPTSASDSGATAHGETRRADRRPQTLNDHRGTHATHTPWVSKHPTPAAAAATTRPRVGGAASHGWMGGQSRHIEYECRRGWLLRGRREVGRNAHLIGLSVSSSCCWCWFTRLLPAVGVVVSASLDPDSLRLFQEDLKDDDHELVIATCGRLVAVAHLLGQQRTRNELIPFLLEYVEQDSDEAHTIIARHLGEFTEVSTEQTGRHWRRQAPATASRRTAFPPPHRSLPRSLSVCSACRWLRQRLYPPPSPGEALQ